MGFTPNPLTKQEYRGPGIIMDMKGKVLFYRNLHTMLKAGMDIMKALRLLIDQRQDRRTGEVLDILKEGIERGETLYGTVSENPKHFTEIERELLGVGERSGSLVEILDLLTDYFESLLSFRNQLTSAMLYPLFLIHTLFLIGPFMSFVFQPDYSLGQFILTLITVIFYIDLVPLILWQITRIEGIRDMAMGVMAKVAILVKFDIMKFILALKSMYHAGVDLSTSLAVSSRVCSNRVVRDVCHAMADRVRRGRTLTDCFTQASLFPTMVVSMIETGEKSGALDSMLAKIGEYYMDGVKRAIAAFQKIFPKIIFAIIAIYIASQVASYYKDYFSMYDVVE